MSTPSDDAVTRFEFLRRATLGASGLGLATLAGCQREQQVVNAPTAASGSPAGYVVAITHGPDDATRVMLALATAGRLPRGDNHLWFAIDGGQIAKKEVAAQVSSPLFPQQGTAAEMLAKIQEQGVHVHI